MAESIRLVVIDLDGTLLDSQKQLNQYTLDVIEAVKQRGVLVTLATGRTLCATAPVARRLGIVLPLITYNGAYIATAGQQQILARSAMQPEAAAGLLRQLEATGCYLKVYIDEHLYVQETTPETIAFSERFGIPFTAVGRGKLANLPAAPLKIAVIEHSEKIQEAWRVLDKWRQQFSICRDGEHGIEITGKAVSKGSGLLTLCDFLRVAPAAVMAFGNEGNDISLLRNAGVGVAMGNACDELKKTARIVAKTNDESGVADLLYTWFIAAGRRS
ncbi:MAG: Cof-type HAD-IIB family hydrolase [Sporomusaceae bacterium]|nr:Cof-type HAD-IIB family hydrolase [Sporomusaceae bacterium]